MKKKYEQSKLIQVSNENAPKNQGLDCDVQGNTAGRNSFTWVAFIEIEEKTRSYLSMTGSKGD